jgi:hypothetical protein
MGGSFFISDSTALRKNHQKTTISKFISRAASQIFYNLKESAFYYFS